MKRNRIAVGLWLGCAFGVLPPSANAQGSWSWPEKYYLAVNECNQLLTRWGDFVFGSKKNLALQVKRLREKPVRAIRSDASVSEWVRQHRVYISLTTSPTRLSKIETVLDTLDLEHVSQIFLSLPERFGRTGEAYVIPESLLRREKLKILRPREDEGPVSKLTTALELLQEKDPESLLITIDDDIGYARGMINEYIYIAAQNPGVVVTGKGQSYSYFGISAPPTWANKSDSRKFLEGSLKPVDIVEGFASIAYPVARVPLKEIRRYARASQEAFASDDLTISLALEKAGVAKYQVLSRYFSIAGVQPFAYGHGSDALHRGAGLIGIESNVNSLKYQATFRQLRSEVFSPEALGTDR